MLRRNYGYKCLFVGIASIFGYSLYGNEELALYTAHETKGMSGLDEDGILNVLREDQCVIHDHNKVNYNDKYDFCNIECNAHLLRDLEKVSINLPNREWSKRLKNHIYSYLF